MCLPERLFGISLDEYVAYETVKQVRIRDRNLGCFYLLLCFISALWVLGFQILYKNEHFQLLDVKGRARLTIQQPTKGGCNPNKPDCEDAYRPLTELPYCERFAGPSPERVASRPCIFADQHELVPEGVMETTLFIPTRIDSMIEEQACNPSDANGWSCSKSYQVVENTKNVFVADIESYTIMMAHTYFRGEVMGLSLEHQGTYYECRNATSGAVVASYPCAGILTKKPIECLPGLTCSYEVPRGTLLGLAEDLDEVAFVQGGRGRLRAASASRAKAPGAFAIPDGDIFSLKKLLDLAGLDLDGSPNAAGEKLRERGTVLDVEVVYKNLHPFTSSFGDGRVSYVYRVIERPVKEMKKENYAARQPADYPRTRRIENRHGILLRVTIMGSFGQFSLIYLLVMLTTSLALLGVAAKLTDFLAMHMMRRREEYTHYKYESTDIKAAESIF